MNARFSFFAFRPRPENPSASAPGHSRIENRKPKIRRLRAAFTLLEVLVSLLIFALAAIVLGSAYVNVLLGYDIVGRSNVADADLAFARAQLLLEADVKKVADGAEFDTADGRHGRWSAEVTPTTTADLFNVAFTCELSDTTGAEPIKTTETFLLLRPTWSIDAGERGKLREEAKKRIFEMQGKKS
ncbi:MAG: hypothetical protein RLZZ15_1544 [Verrucomicrobiota bacterium]|jgi:general secretion pathway protein I